MDWRVLGPLEVWADGSPVNLGGRQRRLVLAILLANVDQTVSTDRVIEEVWGGSPPDSARKTVQAHVAHLRKALNLDSEVVAPSGEGYVVNPAPGDIDAFRFETAVVGARKTHGDPEQVVEVLDEALGLFHGEPYAGMADDALMVKVEATRLSELRLAAREDRLEALLASGEAAKVAADVERLLAEHPLRERLWAIQMLALYRDGRQSDALRSYSRARQTLSEELGIEPSHELRALEQQILDQDDSLADSTLTPATPSPTVDVRRNPYKGLRAFDEADWPDFFGRSEITTRLADRVLAHKPAKLTVIAGPSGAGKSSVLRAGLVPKLREEGLVIALMYPGSDPLERLAESRRDAVEGLDREHAAVDVVAIDQFEEVFTMASTGEKVEQFLDMISSEGDATRWVLTVRADFLDRMLAHEQVGPELEGSLVLVPPLQGHEIEDAIVEPARRVGVGVDPGLVAALTRDVRSSRAALPLLQYVLTDLFERRRVDVLELSPYERAGGLSGVLARRADHVYKSLTGEGRDLAHRLFLQLTTIAENGEFVRSRVLRHVLTSGSEEGSIDWLLEQFGSQRLLTFDQDPKTGEPTVEIAHEALLSAWPRLARWVDGAREDLRMRSRLESAVSEWQAHDREPDFLLTEGRLGLYRAWAGDSGIFLTAQQTRYLEESMERDQEMAKRRRRRRRLIMGAFAMAAVVATVLGIMAILRAREATAEAWAASARAVLEEDPELSVLLAIEALEANPGSPGAASALNVALQEHRTVFSIERPPDSYVIGSLSPDGRLLAVVTDVAVLEVFDLSGDGESLWSDEAAESLILGTPFFTSDGSQLVVHTTYDSAVATENPPPGTWMIYDAITGELVDSSTIDEHCLYPPWAATTGTGFLDLERPLMMARDPLDPNGIGCDVGLEMNLVSFDIRSGEMLELGVIQPDIPGFPTVSADGSRYAVAGRGPGGVYEMGRSDPILALGPGMSTLSDDGSLVLAGNSPLFLLDVATGDTIREYQGHYAHAYFSDSGRLVYASSFDGATRVFDTFTGEMLFELRGSGSRDLTISMSVDEGFVGTFSGDGNARVWDIRSSLVGTGSQAVYETEGTVSGVPGTLVTDDLVIVPIRVDGGNGGETAIYDIDGGDLIRKLDGIALAVSPDASQVLMQSWPGTIELENEAGDSDVFHLVEHFQIVDLQSREVVAELEGPCVWYNQATAEIPGPDCEDYPGPWVEFAVSGAFSPDGSLVAVAGTSGYVTVWDTESGEIAKHFDSLGGGNQAPWGWGAVEFSPEGDYLAVHQWDAGRPYVLKKVSTSTWETEAEIDDLEQPLNEIEFTSDGSQLVAVDWSANGLVVDTHDWELGPPLEGQQGGALPDVDVSPDGRLAVTAAPDGVVWFWDLETKKVVRRMDFPATAARDGIVSVEFVDDETVLVSDATATVMMTLSDEELLTEAKARVTRTFTEQECATYGIEPCPADTASGSQ